MFQLKWFECFINNNKCSILVVVYNNKYLSRTDEKYLLYLRKKKDSMVKSIDSYDETLRTFNTGNTLLYIIRIRLLG